MRLLITDLDNTLYDWVTYFASSFGAMVKALANVLAVDEELLLDEFKAVHQRHGSSEHPFAIFELPSVQRRFPNATRAELLQELQSPIEAFRAAREKHLVLYPGVANTLETLRDEGVIIVAHTEAVAVHACYRLTRLNVVSCFRHIYALDGKLEPHPNPERGAELTPPPDLIRVIPRSERKPNPELLRDICSREGVRVQDTFYVGDSLTRDVSMAKTAGVTAIWAKYGTRYDARLWDSLVRVTHWTAADVAREANLSESHQSILPDYTIESFAELVGLVLPRADHADRQSAPL